MSVSSSPRNARKVHLGKSDAPTNRQILPGLSKSHLKRGVDPPGLSIIPCLLSLGLFAKKTAHPKLSFAENNHRLQPTHPAVAGGIPPVGMAVEATIGYYCCSLSTSFGFG